MRIDVYYSTNTNRYLFKSYNPGDPEYDWLINMKLLDCAYIKGGKNKLASSVVYLDGPYAEMGFIKA